MSVSSFGRTTSIKGSISIKGILVLIFVIFGFSSGYAQISEGKKSFKVSGKVFQDDDQDGKTPVLGATVAMADYAMGVFTEHDGSFAITNVPRGKGRLTVKFLGKVSIDTIIEVNRDLNLTFLMNDENFQLVNIVVTAESNMRGQSTGSKIGRNAIDHLQATSLADVLTLQPGALFANQDLTNAKQASIRSAGLSTATDGSAVNASTNNATVMNMFGTSIIQDGAPISNNANLQGVNSTLGGATTSAAGGASPFGGADLRSVSMDNVESIEIIRGIPSVQYGDLTSGAVIIKSKAGKEPLRVSLKANPKAYQGSVSTGFSLGEKRGGINLSGDYAHNSSKPTESYVTYQRFNLRGAYSNRFFEDKLTSNTALTINYGRDRRKANPDDRVKMLTSEGDELGLSLNTNGVFAFKNSILSNISYTLSASYVEKNSYKAENHTSANAPYSMTKEDGMVLSNKLYTGIYDVDGNQITRVSSIDYAHFLPSTYYGRYDIEGQEVSVFGKLAATFFKRIGNTNNKVLVGGDFKTEGNEGDGQTFDRTTPPYRNVSMFNSTFRPRAFKDVPYLNQLGLFVEEHFNYEFLERDLHLTAGLRYDKYSVADGVLAPRFNASFEMLPKTFFIRGGYGISAKAPSLLFLYPEKAYFEYVNLNEIGSSVVAEEDQLLITTTRVFDAQNKDIKVAQNRKIEIGFDLVFGQRSLHVTGFAEKMTNGYSLSTTVNSYKPVDYVEYQRTAAGIELKATHPVLAKFYMPTNDRTNISKGVEFDLNLGRFNAIRTAFVLNGMWSREESYSNNYTLFDGNSSVSPSQRTHVGVYEAGMEKQLRERFLTTLRITHNIPEIGFVVTLSGQAIWKDADWYKYGNDSIPTKFISKYDGKLYDLDPENLDPAMITQADYDLLKRQVSVKNYIKESYPPMLTLNLNVTKELGDFMRVSFFANNMFRSYHMSDKKREPGTKERRGIPFFYGVEVSMKF